MAMICFPPWMKFWDWMPWRENQVVATVQHSALGSGRTTRNKGAFCPPLLSSLFNSAILALPSLALSIWSEDKVTWGGLCTSKEKQQWESLLCIFFIKVNKKEGWREGRTKNCPEMPCIHCVLGLLATDGEGKGSSCSHLLCSLHPLQMIIDPHLFTMFRLQEAVDCN